MANTALLPFEASEQGTPAPASAKPLRDGTPTVRRTEQEERRLSSASVGETVSVVGLTLEGDQRAWLGAVGIGIGERLTLLRRAAFGGPLHVRTSAGGEFALNLALARSICIQLLGESDESAE